ncbi:MULTISPECIES: isoaspartyl peptidase/L-asparaginase family protein [Gammaproteobacteria]|uniref:isoaspartyl peptidase/L-asparaginase family protein n=1 Tax=Gammaproteobacteria TaxID=1236 RepID=UPI000DCFA05B|nr:MULTISPECIES: isoaspartyl peptidase/L-asparaginase [Gammaproteobacteria]RTE87307.1 isoaspartyl peptidase/L-asparaginase [Aliidiomarina sp. B3213]TCZ92907.1 isoaspartyl peptidase/L-asparaginase [Lysobacter sp. N42]
MKLRHLVIALTAGATLLACSDNEPNSVGDAPIAIAIHGGAGTITRDNLSREKEAEIREALTLATEAGYAVLESGGEAVDAVQAAIQVLEENPLFNAGRGAVYTYEGRHELDASIMLGDTLEAGAVSGVTNIKSPIEAARAVMERSRHVFLSGEGAESFAREQGLEQVSNTYFNTPHRYEQLQRALTALNQTEDETTLIAHQHWDNAFNMGTVGAVALDADGNLAAGTSTGGMTAKRWGRIGDSPVIGAGTWADNESCAVSATGHGEYFIRYHVAADICSRVKYQQLSVVEAGDQVIHDVLVNAGGTGGVIILDPMGNISMPFNTEGMYRASKTSNEQLTVGIYREE